MTKRRHFGNVYRRTKSSGRYYVRYTVDGVQYRGDRTFTTKVEAQRYLSELETLVYSGTWIDPVRRAERLGDYAEQWIRDRQLSVRTRELYEDLLKLHVRPQLGDRQIGKLTPAAVRAWYRERGEATGRPRLRQAYSFLRAVLETAVEDGMLASNPCRIEGAGVVRSAERPLITKPQAEALIAAMPEHMRVAVVVTLLAHLRRGELLAMRWGDVDFDAGTLRIERSKVRARSGSFEKDTKTGHARTVYLPEEALSALRSYRKVVGHTHHQDYLFTHLVGPADDPRRVPLEAHHLRVAWDRARKSTGLEHVHWHDLRHAGLTWVAQAGASLKELMARGGHRSVNAAMIYQHAAEERDAELAAKLTLSGDGPKHDEIAAEGA